MIGTLQVRLRRFFRRILTRPRIDLPLFGEFVSALPPSTHGVNMTLDELKTRRNAAIGARDQMLANINSIIGQIGLLDEMIAAGEKEAAESADGAVEQAK